MSAQRPSARRDFEIAIICALPLEFDAVSLLFDEFLDEDGDRYKRAYGDPNHYTTGRIGKFYVVLVLLSRMGKASAASAAATIKCSYDGLKLALLVGICGGVPRVKHLHQDMLLGDVVISKTVIQHDFGRRYPDRFSRKDTIENSLCRPNKDFSNLLIIFETEHGRCRLQEMTAVLLRQLQARADSGGTGSKYVYPGTEEDKLFDSGYRHKHQAQSTCSICSQCNEGMGPVCDEAITSTCADLDCDEENLLQRGRLEVKRQLERDKCNNAQDPFVFVGPIASGDTVMKSGEDRDLIAKQEGVIAFEMEGAGVWEVMPCVVVKGVCDYADSHKSKKWQDFAAATAASAARAILERYIQADKYPLVVSKYSGHSMPSKPEKPTVEPVYSNLVKELESIITSRILLDLEFSDLRVRLDGIPTAAKRTYEWIYRRSRNSTDYWADFVHWLESGCGCYWISGKPGSGKSTLMKFIHFNGRTSKHLKQWSNGSRLVTSSFFFWNSGSTMQRSLLGLIRTLLHGILTQIPELTPKLLPERWEQLRWVVTGATDTQKAIEDIKKEPLEPWSLTKYLKAFRRLLDPNLADNKYFFFIDGLDECDGDQAQLVDLLKEMAKTSYIKICVASRPWPIFESAFGGHAKLTLQYLTYQDMNVYVTSTFGADREYLSLEQRDPDTAAKLCKEIVTKSSGVFLWVALVVKFLLDGIWNGDRLSDMQQRLEELPADLDLLFRKIFDSIDRRYFEHKEDDELAWNNSNWSPLTDSEIMHRFDTLKKRLASRTKGLLEIPLLREDNQGSLDDWVFADGRDPLEERPESLLMNSFPTAKLKKSFKSSKVRYLHRTVKDFVHKDGIWTEICLSSPRYDPDFLSFKESTFRLKYSDPADWPEKELHELLSIICREAQYGRRKLGKRLTRYLNGMNDALKQIPCYYEVLCQHPTFEPLMKFALQSDLGWWVKRQVKKKTRRTCPHSRRPYLLIAVENQSLESIHILLKAGNDCWQEPFEVVDEGYGCHGSYTSLAWETVETMILASLRRLTEWREYGVSDQHEQRNCIEWIEIARIFISHGVYPQALNHFIPEDDILKMRSHFPDLINEVEQIWPQ